MTRKTPTDHTHSVDGPVVGAQPPKAPSLESVLRDVRACTHCAQQLPFGPRPVVAASAQATVLIVGQAPGTKVHTSGIPWDDASGKRLRRWLSVDTQTFYDPNQFAIMPMGFCYPGRGKSGDLPPRRECAPLWHEQIRQCLPNIRLTLLIGSYAQRYYLSDKASTLTETVRRWADYLPDYLPLVHPSPRNQLWLTRNPWFESELVPQLRSIMAGLVANPDSKKSAQSKEH